MNVNAALFVVFASLAFATSAPLARYARPADPLVIALGRVAIAGAVLIAADRGRALATLRAMRPTERRIVFGAGALLGAHFGLFLWGLDHTSLASAVTLVSLEPLGVVLCAWALHGLRPTALERIGVIVATVGALIVARASGSGEHRLIGDLAVLGAVALFGLYVNLARSLRDVLPATRYAGLVYVGAALVLLGAVLVAPAAGARWPLSFRSIAAIVAIALVPTLVGHTVVQAAARKIPPSIVALVSPGETVGAIAIGAVLLGTSPTPTEILGALVILGGSMIVILARKSGGSGSVA